ncbi:ORF A [Trichoplusia ni TED virus]|uniref:ORF A n=1 Tax=Trichoplusia ni TED virus TaxID=2083181 RepID=Q65352_9VIRU|nr:ORF A [Trichoplusia ni TED virus]AAA92248.1 ORF A [Trichoplusia ni TED virus]
MPHDPDVIFKALRLVPEFNGNPNILTRFINICDKLVEQYASAEPGSELGNLCLLNGILNKVTGTAASTINANGIPETWVGIRSSLINNFSDQRDETALYNDLSLASQGNKTPQEFYEQCQTLFSTIMTYVTLHETLPTTIEAKRALYKKVTVQAFVRGLKEPLGSRIRCMRPETIEKALEYVQEELNVIYLQQRNESSRAHSSPKMLPIPQQSPVTPFNTLGIHRPPVPNWPVPMGQRGNQPPPQPFKFNVPNQYHNRMPTKTQQMLRAPPPNYHPQSNVFRLPPRNPPPNQIVKPMSGVQHFVPKTLPVMTGHDWRKSGNPPPNNYFKTRELNVNEFYSSDDSYNSVDYYSEPGCDYYTDYYNNPYDYDTNATCYDLPYDASETEAQPGPSHVHESQDFQSTKPSNEQG